MAETEAILAPPYGGFRTLLNFLDKVADAPPPRIDRTYIKNLDGTQQAQLLSALRTFGLIGEQGEVTPQLLLLAQDRTSRPGGIAALLQTHYDWALPLNERNATHGQLEEAFRKFGIGGATLRKAITFYMHAAKYAQIELSPNFKSVRTQASTSGTKKTSKRTPRGRKAEQVIHGNGQPTAKGSARTVMLPSGETVSLTVTRDVLALPTDERNWVLEVVSKFDEFEQAHPGENGSEDDWALDEEDA